MLQEEQLQTSEREKQSAKQQLTRKVNVLLSFALAHHSFFSLILQKAEFEAELMRNKEELSRKESELLRAEETIRREQQQIQEMRQRVSLVCVCVGCGGKKERKRVHPRVWEACANLTACGCLVV